MTYARHEIRGMDSPPPPGRTLNVVFETIEHDEVTGVDTFIWRYAGTAGEDLERGPGDSWSHTHRHAHPDGTDTHDAASPLHNMDPPVPRDRLGRVDMWRLSALLGRILSLEGITQHAVGIPGYDGSADLADNIERYLRGDE